MDCLEGYGCCPPLDCLFTSHRQRKKKERSGPLVMHESSDEEDSGEGHTEAGFSEGEESKMSTLTPGSDESKQGSSAEDEESGAEDEEGKMKLLKVAKLHKNQDACTNAYKPCAFAVDCMIYCSLISQMTVCA